MAKIFKPSKEQQEALDKNKHQGDLLHDLICHRQNQIESKDIIKDPVLEHYRQLCRNLSTSNCSLLSKCYVEEFKT